MSSSREFCEIWKKESRDLFKRCLRWTGRRDLAEEAFSRAAIVAFQKFSSFRGGPEQVGGWLRRLAHNVCVDLHREGLRKREQRLEDLQETSSITARQAVVAGNPEDHALRSELVRLLERAIEELPVRLRGPVALLVEDQMGYREIAERLAIREDTARKRMQLARQILRRRLAAYASNAGAASRPRRRPKAGARPRPR